MTTWPTWTEGVCGDGAAILRDGVMVPIADVLGELNEAAADNERLRAAMREALAAFRLQGADDSLIQAIGRSAIIICNALGE